MPAASDNPLDSPDSQTGVDTTVRPQEAADGEAIEAAGTEGNISMAEAVKMVQEANAPLVAQINELTQGQQASQGRFEELTSSMVAGQNQLTAAVTPKVEPTDFLTELTSGNAESAIAEVVRKELQGIMPTLSNIVQSGSSAFVDLEAVGIDERFGKGSWDKFFKEPMTRIMTSYSKNNPAAMTDRSVIAQEVNGLVGQQVESLVKFQTESKTAKTTAETTEASDLVNTVASEVVNRTNGMGGIRAIEATGNIAITPELEGYLAERDRATGQKTNAKEWVKETDFGNDIDSYRASLQTSQKTNGAA